PEANLLAVAHYLEALKWQKELVKIHTIFGGKNPHPNYLVGGMASPIALQSDTAINIARLNMIKDLITQANDFVNQIYIPDLLAIASFYPEWTQIGGGLGNYLAYGDIPQGGISDVGSFRIPRGAILNKNLAEVLPVDPGDVNQIQEQVAHSWEGQTTPKYTGPKPPFTQLDETAKYSWLKAPRWKGNAVEVGPLSRMLVGYASGKTEYKDVVNNALGALKVPATALFSTLGRTAARGLETQLCAKWLMDEYNRLIANLKAGDSTTADNTKWNPSSWPSEAKGYGFTEAPRGA